MIVYPNVKINLGLNVLRRRPDGFHDIETCFVPYFGISDILEIETSGSDSFSVVWENGTPVDWPVEKDLAVRACRMLQQEFSLPPVRMGMVKRSPVGAGLGGGSSDAAFALRAVSDLFGLGLDDAGLASRAALLGSDCAFFILNRPAIGSGRGDVLEPFDLDLSQYEIRVTVPQGISVSTAQAYRGIRPGIPETRVPEILKRPVGEWKDLLANDFEETVFALYPELKELKEQLYAEGAVYAAMSGSGSAVFGIFNNDKL